MELRYEIPKHLEGFIGNIPEPQLNSLITLLFEFAIQHRMLDYPRTEIEVSVEEIQRLCQEIRSMHSVENALIMQLLTGMNVTLTSLHHMVTGGQMPVPVSMPPGVQTGWMPPTVFAQEPPTEPEDNSNDIQMEAANKEASAEAGLDEQEAGFFGEMFK